MVLLQKQSSLSCICLINRNGQTTETSGLLTYFFCLTGKELFAIINSQADGGKINQEVHLH